MTNKITGAGILIYGNYDDKLCVVIAQSSKSKHIYSDFGGKREGNENVEETLYNELLEESIMTFKIDNFDINYHDVIISPIKAYRCYYVKLNNLSDEFIRAYDENRMRIKTSNEAFKETDKITFYPIDNWKNNIMTDVFGNNIILSSRLNYCIKKTCIKVKKIDNINYKISNDKNFKTFILK